MTEPSISASLAWKRRNIDRVRQADRERKAAIPLETKRATNAAWRATVSDEWKVAKRAYNRERGDRLRETDPEYQNRRRAANLERYRELDRARYQRNRAARIIEASRYAAIRRVRIAGQPTFRVTARDWRRLVARYRGCCAYCGVQTAALQREHIIPISRGGAHSVGNILPACQPCNMSKSKRLLVEWRHRQRMGLAA